MTFSVTQHSKSGDIYSKSFYSIDYDGHNVITFNNIPGLEVKLEDVFYMIFDIYMGKTE